MTRNTYQDLATPGFVVDQATAIHGQGRTVDWSKVSGTVFGDPGSREIPAGHIMAILADGQMIPRGGVS